MNGIGSASSSAWCDASNVWAIRSSSNPVLKPAERLLARGFFRREGLNVNPFTGIYSASKHAIEAIAETMSVELQEFGIEVATINPGPFLTGFNDRGFET